MTYLWGVANVTIRGKFVVLKTYVREERFKISNQVFYHRKHEREKIQSKQQKEKYLKLIEKRKLIEKISNTWKQLFKKTSKTDKTLARLTKKIRKMTLI